MDIQWYPGHMSKAMRTMKDDIKLIDVVIEMTDSRVPFSSRNPDIDRLAGGKPRILLLNKDDLADSSVTAEWERYYSHKGFSVLRTDSRTGKGMKKVTGLIDRACSEKLERNRKKGILNRPLRALIAGIPNCGKSTFINSMTKKSSAKTGNKPGVTKGKQWIRLNKNIELLDTPGVLWPKFEDKSTGVKLAMLGSIKDEILNGYELAVNLVEYLQKEYREQVPEVYGICETDDPHGVLELFAGRRGFLKTGGVCDTEKAASVFIDDFRKGKLGRISLERPEDIM